MAILGGVWTTKPFGIAVNGSDSSMRTTSEPACCELVIDWIAACAMAVKGAPNINASVRTRARQSPPMMRFSCMAFIELSPGVGSS